MVKHTYMVLVIMIAYKECYISVDIFVCVNCIKFGLFWNISCIAGQLKFLISSKHYFIFIAEINNYYACTYCGL